MDANEVIERLGLTPHPEGGWYRETWRAPAIHGARSAGTAIYYLLAAGDRSHWHRVDAAEAWHHYAGDPLALAVADETAHTVHELHGSLLDERRPQAVVPAGAWQAARPLGSWSLVGCTVSPAFDFAGFELASVGWTPPGWSTPGW